MAGYEEDGGAGRAVAADSLSIIVQDVVWAVNNGLRRRNFENPRPTR
jgi:hypothetical protein